MFRLNKRSRFILSCLFLSVGFFAVQAIQFSNRYLAIGLLSVVSVLLVFWSLLFNLPGHTALLVWLLPFLFTSGFGFFYFLLPSSLFTILPVLLIFFFALYALFLSENIFTVAAIRTIQLYRSASAVGFLLTLLTSFFWFDTIISFRLAFYWNALLVLAVSFLLFLHGVWFVNLGERISKKLLAYSLVLSLGLGEIAIVLSFWPVSLTLGSLFLTCLVYVFLGLSQAELSERLFKSTVREYLLVGLAVFLIMFWSTQWG